MRLVALIFLFLTFFKCMYADESSSNEQEKAPLSEIASINKVHLQPRCDYFDDLNGWRLCTDVAFRVGYFYPSSKRFRNIFPGTRIDYQLELSQPLIRCFELWENISWYPDCGHSLGRRNHSTIDFIPISFGIKYVFCLNRCLQLRLGGGICYYFLRTSDKWLNQRVICWNHDVGGAFKVDLRYMFARCFHLDAFVDYLHLPLNVRTGVNQVGGTKAGLGLGHRF